MGEAYTMEPCLVHGDLHPGNIIVRQSSIHAIIDWGDLTAGDPASDLACLWMLFEKKEIRQQALEQYSVSESVVKKAIGWAIFYGITLLDAGVEANSPNAKVGKYILRNIDNE
jgi:aminoglycoside phosphotransferase (APT) family kinase protein